MPRMSDEDWDDVINTNLRGAFLFSRAASRLMMRARYGRIINISSVSGLIGNQGQTNYSASKAGLIGMTRSLSRELAGRKVTVNAVAPGFIETEMTKVLEDKYGDAFRKEITGRIPAKRMGTPEEVASAVLFLASRAAAYTTGAVITVDGGHQAVPNIVRPQRQVGFVQVAAQLIKMETIEYMKLHPMADPREIRGMLSQYTYHMLATLPLAGVHVPGLSVRESIREAVHRFISHYELYEALSYLVYRRWQERLEEPPSELLSNVVA